MSEHYEHLQKALCHELELLNKKYTAGAEMTDEDLKRADLLYHTLKSAATYHAMKDAEEERGEYAYRMSGREPHMYSHGGYAEHYPTDWYPAPYGKYRY